MDQINKKKPLNIGLLAHVDAGKTTLTERMLYLSGSVSKVGRVDEGSTHTDLMEPMNRYRVTYPEEMTGRIISEIIGMRGTFDSPSIRKGLAVIECRAPVAESVGFPARISSITLGRGVMNAYFDGYEICPLNEGKETPFRGVSPAGIDKYILHKRGAIG